MCLERFIDHCVASAIENLIVLLQPLLTYSLVQLANMERNKKFVSDLGLPNISKKSKKTRIRKEWGQGPRRASKRLAKQAAALAKQASDSTTTPAAAPATAPAVVPATAPDPASAPVLLRPPDLSLTATQPKWAKLPCNPMYIWNQLREAKSQQPLVCSSDIGCMTVKHYDRTELLNGDGAGVAAGGDVGSGMMDVPELAHLKEAPAPRQAAQTPQLWFLGQSCLNYQANAEPGLPGSQSPNEQRVGSTYGSAQTKCALNEQQTRAVLGGVDGTFPVEELRGQWKVVLSKLRCHWPADRVLGSADLDAGARVLHLGPCCGHYGSVDVNELRRVAGIALCAVCGYSGVGQRVRVASRKDLGIWGDPVTAIAHVRACPSHDGTCSGEGLCRQIKILLGRVYTRSGSDGGGKDRPR